MHPYIQRVERAQSGPRFLFAGLMIDDMAALTDEVRRRVADLGFELVDLRRGGTRQRPLLQARIDKPNSEPGQGVTVGDCATVSRALEYWLDERQVIGLKYILEVSSPGIERPVRWPEHWRRFTGQDVHVRVKGRGRLRATIVGLANENSAVILRPHGEGGEMTVPLGEVLDATLAVDWTD